jgi:membrane-associated phospholipid phosphatase
MKLSKRRVVCLIILLVFLAIYFPINRFASGGWALSLPIDNSIPLYPPALIPYLFGSLLFVGFPIWASLYSKKGEYEAYVISFLTISLISYVLYLVLPTYVIRPEITSQDCFSRAIIILYQNDYPYNAAPSGHAFYTLISFLYLRRWKPKLQLVSLIVAILIIASTLLTKQHYILDIISGLILGFITYWAGRYIQRKWDLIFAN